MLRRLAIHVTRGTSNNLFQVATLVRAATALEARVEVLFCDDALLLLRRDTINEPAWSPIYAGILPGLQERLRDAEFVDMARFLRDAKEHGDEVHFWACQETLTRQGLTLGELASILDGERPLPEFLAAATDADAVLTF